MTIANLQGIKSPKKRLPEILRQYQFKPGNNANPKGRPKAILSKKERLELLSELMKKPTPKRISNRDAIGAVKETNLMEGVYQEAQTGYIDNRQVNIIVLTDKAKELTENVGRRLLPKTNNQEELSPPVASP